MEFPVDVLVSSRHEDLESSAQSYMNKLLYSNPDNTEYLTLPNTRKIRISPANVGFVPLYGANLKHKVLALFAPEDQFTAVALFLVNQWYTVEDLLRTSNPAREGLVKVRSVGERIVLYVLNRIIYRTMEMGTNEVPFLCHEEEVFAKTLWKNGEAVGFYSVKCKGSLCNTFVSQCYLLPVMDSIFVRKSHRSNGHGLQMLEDFVDSFKDDELGLKYPLTTAMQRVCSQYLRRYPADVDLLWEVEGVGGPYQKVKIATKLGSMTLQCNHSSWAAEESKNGEVNEVEMTEESLDITEDVVVVKHRKVAKEINDLPISTRTRSSEHTNKKRPREEPEEIAGENRPEKINRLVEPEAETDPDAVPETKELTDGESGEEQDQEEEKPSVQVEAVVTPEAPVAETEILVAEVNGEMSESHEEEYERSANTVEDEPVEQELPLETEAVVQNGADEEMEADRDAQDDIVNTSDKSEEASEAVEQMDQEPVTEEKQEVEAEVSPLVEDEGEVELEREEEAVFSAEKEAASSVKDEAAFAAEEEATSATEAEVASAVEKEAAFADEDEAVSAVEEEAASAVDETEDSDHPPEAPVLSTNLVECVSSLQDDEASDELVASEQEASMEEITASPIEENNEPAVNQEDETISDEPLETEESQPGTEDSENEEEKLPEGEDKDEQKEGEETATTEDDDEEGKSSDGIQDSPIGVRVLRGGISKPVPPTPKRTSNRLRKAVVIQEISDEFDEEEGEEKLTSTEEKASTEEDEVVEHSSEEEKEEEEPPVVDRRVLRRKTKVVQSTPTKAKRRSKNI
ncbi:soluble lamin-associated protein of 75 kDa [Danio aesculapii]|uniref:soluble lamin-associated protein of 75 kDa n=1 Tax=Danio aesculapii TaxID=1142201 RepID=UPI0024C0337D|nr:soluble lamin-associated protein of 75 kDa [Danio aesculapii]XP_056303128.1 soluble lamin-associated protein of 75 kDa [Danio aesculapii]